VATRPMRDNHHQWSNNVDEKASGHFLRSSNMPSAEAQANALVTLLESLHPRWALTPHLSRLEAIVADLKRTQVTEEVKSPNAVDSQPRNPIAPAINYAQQVWNDKTILARILDFDGTLGYFYRNYDVFVGYDRPKPQNRTKLLTGRPGNRAIPFVNKACYSLTLGEEGLQHLQASEKSRLERQVAIAKTTRSDGSVSWLARFYAMAIADEAVSLEALIKKYSKSKESSGGFGSALNLYYSDDYFELTLPQGHEFEGCAQTDLVELKMDHEHDNPHLCLIVELAYNAMQVGALRTLEVLKRHFGWGLHCFELDDTGTDFLSKFVEYACTKPYVKHHSQCIRTLLRGEAISPENQYHVPGSAGNLLHLAAAKGDFELVSALLDCGFDPSVKCEQGDCFIQDGDERLEFRKELALPEDWARVRGHTRVEQILKQRRALLRPDLRIRFAGRPHFNGKLVRFFPEAKRQYGFIIPDPGQDGLRGRGSSSIFVHISNLQRGAKGEGASNAMYPQPGQRLCFSVGKDKRGRLKADIVISAEDWSYVNLLQMEPWEADDWWGKYNDAGSESEGEEEANDSDGVEGDENQAEVPKVISIPVALLGLKEGYSAFQGSKLLTGTFKIPALGVEEGRYLGLT
jgi:cold shock CspA family protein